MVPLSTNLTNLTAVLQIQGKGPKHAGLCFRHCGFKIWEIQVFSGKYFEKYHAKNILNEKSHKLLRRQVNISFFKRRFQLAMFSCSYFYLFCWVIRCSGIWRTSWRKNWQFDRHFGDIVTQFTWWHFIRSFCWNATYHYRYSN